MISSPFPSLTTKLLQQPLSPPPSMFSPANPPDLPWAPSPSPTQPPSSDLLAASYHQASTPLHPTPSKQPIDFSPPLIAMVVIAAAAFLIVTYSRLISRHFLPPLLSQIRRYRRWRRRRLLLPSSFVTASDVSAADSPPYTTSDVIYSPYGLDESVVKSMPLSIYSEKKRLKGGSVDEFSSDCAVCLLEFVESDYVRTLPLCAHSFHVDCIDVWLRSQANCPLCRAGILPRDWPFIPVMAARIRPNIDEALLLDSLFLDPQPESRRSESVITVPEIIPAPIDNEASPASGRAIQSESRPEMLKRSYSFGFERNFASERLVLEPATASPWRYQNRRGSFSFWRPPSPFSSLTKHRVFSFRSNRGMKSPLFGRRRTGALVPLSESASIRYAYYYSSSAGIGAGSSRRSKSMASPMFGRSSAALFSSSRMRCGDPEALISPERYGSQR